MFEKKIIVLTGNGKGKTTTALGVCFEGWLEEKKVLFLQFLKGERSYGELNAAASLGDHFKIKQMGLGFVRNADEETLALHKQYAVRALEEASKEITSGNYDIIVLDEINYAIHFNLLSVEEVLAVIRQKPPGLMLILTGRHAHEKIVEYADEVYEFREIKHHSSRGLKAVKGIEY